MDKLKETGTARNNESQIIAHIQNEQLTRMRQTHIFLT